MTMSPLYDRSIESKRLLFRPGLCENGRIYLLDPGTAGEAGFLLLASSFGSCFTFGVTACVCVVPVVTLGAVNLFNQEVLKTSFITMVNGSRTMNTRMSDAMASAFQRLRDFSNCAKAC